MNSHPFNMNQGREMSESDGSDDASKQGGPSSSVKDAKSKANAANSSGNVASNAPPASSSAPNQSAAASAPQQ